MNECKSSNCRFRSSVQVGSSYIFSVAV